jgi:hypothetical protein
MPVQEADIELYQGDDWAATVWVYMPDNTPADLTGYTGQAQIRTAPADQDPNVAAEMVVTVVPPNQVSVYLPHSESVLASGFNYVWDLQLTSAAGEITTILAGEVTVDLEVTREATA